LTRIGRNSVVKNVKKFPEHIEKNLPENTLTLPKNRKNPKTFQSFITHVFSKSKSIQLRMNLVNHEVRHILIEVRRIKTDFDLDS